MEKGQKSFEIWPIPFKNNDPINAQLENTGKILVVLRTTSPLDYVVYPISEGNSSTTLNLLIRFKINILQGMNVMNDGK